MPPVSTKEFSDCFFNGLIVRKASDRILIPTATFVISLMPSIPQGTYGGQRLGGLLHTCSVLPSCQVCPKHDPIDMYAQAPIQLCAVIPCREPLSKQATSSLRPVSMSPSDMIIFRSKMQLPNPPIYLSYPSTYQQRSHLCPDVSHDRSHAAVSLLPALLNDIPDH
jgi:hypothetical protein